MKINSMICITCKRQASPKAVLRQNIKSLFGCSGIGCMMAPSTMIRCLGVVSIARPSLCSQGQKRRVVPLRHTQQPFQPRFRASSTCCRFRKSHFFTLRKLNREDNKCDISTNSSSLHHICTYVVLYKQKNISIRKFLLN